MDAGEVYFYHLTRRRLEDALPDLLSRTLARGWRAVVRAGSEARVEDLDRLLWSFAEESFLPHGTAATGWPERQPVYLTAGPETPNAPDLLFLVDGSDEEPEAMRRYARVCVLFDGRDEAAVRRARALWKRVAEAGLAAAYFAETPAGGWEKQAAANEG